jgi:glycosyltransferase involved in cell wall biosynthesis
MPTISVVIATRNRANLLHACLSSLLQQTLSPEHYEICVVDNGSTDDTQKIIADLAAKYTAHRLFTVIETKLGLSWARNRGIAATSASLIAFCDDDTLLPPDWLERYVLRFSSLPPETVKIGGEVNPIWEKPCSSWITEAMLCLLSAHSSIKSDQARFCRPGSGEALVECNCCYRRDALERMGGFPTELGRKNDNLLSGENALDYRLVVEGGRFFYDPDILVNHLIHSDRLTPEWFKRRYFWQGVTDFAVRIYLTKHGVTPPPAHAIGVPISEMDWTKIANKTPDNLDDTLNKIRGIGFMMAMVGAIEL